MRTAIYIRLSMKACLFIKFVAEQADEPVEGEEEGLELVPQKVAVDFRKEVLYQLVENFNFHSYPDHLGVVVERQDILNQHGEEPESRFFGFHMLHEASHNEIHPLTVANHWVPFCEGLEDVPHVRHVFGTLVEAILFICKGPSQIQINLIKMRVGIARKSFKQGLVVPAVESVPLQVLEGPSAHLPKKLSILLRDPLR